MSVVTEIISKYFLALLFPHSGYIAKITTFSRKNKPEECSSILASFKAGS
jgi:hypothetical protein